MNVADNAIKLLNWLREQPLDSEVSVADIAASGVLMSRDASDAVQYCLRSGVLERVKISGARPHERVKYRFTGRALPVATRTSAAPSFDGLLSAWGIALNPPVLSVLNVRRMQITD